MTFAALVLAAGAGTRFGGGKLAARFRGEPLVHHAIRAARAAPVDRVVVVAAPGLDIGRWEPPGPPVQRVELASGALSDTLRAGLGVLDDVAGAFVFLGDMPLVPHDVAGKLAAAIGTRLAAQPRLGDRPAHPVLLSAQAFPLVATLRGDEGAGRLLRQRTDVALVEIADPGAVFDVDYPEDIARRPDC
ncbi:MAG: NTP transferase domain-containing protein [Novosphingobium sp.]